jgi:Tfp pilus assembly protein PilV
MEALIALAILGLVVTTLVRVQVQAMRAEALAEARDRAVFEAEGVAAGVWLGRDEAAVLDEARGRGWKVDCTAPEGEALAGWREWAVAVSNPPAAPVVRLWLRAGARP